MMITIRPILHSELEALRQLAIEIYRITFEKDNTEENMQQYLAKAFSREQVEAEMSEVGSYFYGAYVDGKMVGYLRLRTSEEANQYLGASNIELQRLYVHPATQGQGISSELMKTAIQKTRELQLQWLWLGVWENNVKAQAIYQKWGFEKFSEHVFWMGDDAQTDWLMKLRVV
jgi:ribosomal protein S18 acetylase RimI-like enzyme